MRKWIVRALALIGALTLMFLGLVVAGVAAAMSHTRTAPLPAKIVLETQLHRGIVERRDSGFFDGLGPQAPTLRDLVLGLEHAADDKRVVGLVSDLSQVKGGIAQLQELRDAVIAFRKKGKKAVAFADTFGELGPADGAFYLASAYDEIYVQPSGAVGLTGLAVEAPFGRALLEKIGVRADFRQRKEYKSAPEMFLRDDFSAPAREETEALVASEFSQIVRGVAEGRKLTEDDIRGLVDRGPLQAEEALAAKLIDGVAYRDQVYEKVLSGEGKKPTPLYLSSYLKRIEPVKGRQVVALIYGTGQVERGGPDESGLETDDSMRSGKLAAEIRQAAEDEDVKAIVLRVDSPGGSYVASDTIRREVLRARDDKPVIVSMGNVAASGGYFVAMDADKVVAQPGTLTGSIGVFAGKFIVTDLLTKLGVNFTSVSRGEMSTFWSMDQPFTPVQSRKLEDWLDFVYDDFTKKAASGRKVPLEKMLEVAKGRVWTGEDALRVGLVDALGGLVAARALAIEAAKLPKDKPVELRVYPPEEAPLERIAELVAGEGADSSEEEGKTSARLGLPLRGLLRGVAAAARAAVLEADRVGPLRSSAPDVAW